MNIFKQDSSSQFLCMLIMNLTSSGEVLISITGTWVIVCLILSSRFLGTNTMLIFYAKTILIMTETVSERVSTGTWQRKYLTEKVLDRESIWQRMNLTETVSHREYTISDRERFSQRMYLTETESDRECILQIMFLIENVCDRKYVNKRLFNGRILCNSTM